MQENVGGVDLVTRSIVGPVLLAVGGLTLMRGTEGRAIGVTALLTGCSITESAITRTCPLNAALGVDTRKRRRFWQ